MNQANKAMLRNYQAAAVESVLRAMTGAPGRTRRLMVEVPTGGGKGHIICNLVDRLPDDQVLVLTPRVRILQQLRLKLSPHGVLSGRLGNATGKDHRVVIATPQTLMRRPEIRTPTVIIVDENHLVAAGSAYEGLLKRYPDAQVIGLTATPFRQNRHLNEQGMRWHTVYAIPMHQLIDEGWLVEPVSMSTGENCDISACAKTDLAEMTKRIVGRLISGVVDGRRKRCLVSCLNIAHAKQVQALLIAAGEKNVELVHSRQRRAEQEAGFANFENADERSWLIHVGLVSVGVDIPCLDSIAIIRDVYSFALLAQIIGRGLRLFPGKTECLVFDFGGGSERFGFINAPDLGVRRKGVATAAAHSLFKSCPMCKALSYRSASRCKHCGHEFPRTTALREDASSTPLLSPKLPDSMLEAEYAGQISTQNASGVWCVEHQLRRGPEVMLAYEYTRTQPSPYKFPRRGATVLVRRMEAGLVQIVGES